MSSEKMRQVEDFADTDNSSLIQKFFESEGDANVGLELSRRIFRHAEFDQDPDSTPLIGRSGEQVVRDGVALNLTDYVNFAAQNHFEAIEGILQFLLAEPGTKEYEAIRGVILGRLGSKL